MLGEHCHSSRASGGEHDYWFLLFLSLPSQYEKVVSSLRHNFAISHALLATYMYIDWEVYSIFVMLPVKLVFSD